MRAWPALLFVALAFSGCTQGDETPVDFQESCPAWQQSPGKPAARAVSYYNTTSEFNLAGINVHKPSLIDPDTIEDESFQPLYVTEEGHALDVAEWNLRAATQDGEYVFRVWAAKQYTQPAKNDGQSVEWDDADKERRLAFRDMSRPTGQQLLSEVRVPVDDLGFDHTFRIEFAEVDEAPMPGDLWVEWEFIPDADGDRDTQSSGSFSSTITWWYRRC